MSLIVTIAVPNVSGDDIELLIIVVFPIDWREAPLILDLIKLDGDALHLEIAVPFSFRRYSDVIGGLLVSFGMGSAQNTDQMIVDNPLDFALALLERGVDGDDRFEEIDGLLLDGVDCR